MLLSATRPSPQQPLHSHTAVPHQKPGQRRACAGGDTETPSESSSDEAAAGTPAGQLPPNAEGVAGEGPEHGRRRASPPTPGPRALAPGCGTMNA